MAILQVPGADYLLVSVGPYHAAWVPITAGSGLLVGRGVVTVLRLGLWRLLELFFWMTHFLSLVTHLSLVSPWFMVLLGCGIVPPIFPVRSPLGSCRLEAALVAAVAVPRIFRTLLFFGGSGEGGRKRIRLTKKTNVRKRFWIDPWEQPIPIRWKADTLKYVAFHEQEEGIVCSGVNLSHVSEPTGIG